MKKVELVPTGGLQAHWDLYFYGAKEGTCASARFGRGSAPPLFYAGDRSPTAGEAKGGFFMKKED